MSYIYKKSNQTLGTVPTYAEVEAKIKSWVDRGFDTLHSNSGMKILQISKGGSDAETLSCVHCVVVMSDYVELRFIEAGGPCCHFERKSCQFGKLITS